MRCLPECYPCLENLVRRCALLAARDGHLHDEALEAALAYLDEHFSLDLISTDLAAELQRIIRQRSKNGDPFAAVKKEEMAKARCYAEKLMPVSEAPLKELVQFAAKGNGFDFFQDLQTVERQFQDPVNFAREGIAALEELLRDFHAEGGKKIIYLADNAGECFFDLPLVRRLEQSAEVYYAVKESPVQNDLTVADLAQSGIGEQFTHIVSTGTDSPGLDPASASPDFMKLLQKADLILAKGMGHYETLPELSLPQPVFLIFQVKCNPVAQTSGLPRHSYAAYFLEQARSGQC